MLGIYPTIYATPISVYYEKNTGRTHPMTIQCFADGNEKFDNYVVKLINNTDLKQRSIMREILISKLAIYFAIQTPEPALIEVTHEFVEKYRGTYTFSKLKDNVGTSFGSKELKNAIIYTDERISPEHFEDAAEIFAFDVLVCDFDRRKGNSNLFYNKEGFSIFDHELCLFNVIPGNPIPEINDPISIRSTYQNHVLLDTIKELPKQLNNFTEKLSNLSSDIFDAMVEGFPKNWDYNELEKIKIYLLEISKRADVFQNSILEVLS